MGLTGAAVGASRSLEEIVAARVLAQKLQQAIAERQSNQAMEARRLDETERQNSWQRARTERLDTEAATERGRVRDQEATAKRGRSNMAGVIAMGVDPDTAKREIAFSALNNDTDMPKGVMDVLTPAAPKLRSVTTSGPTGRPINRMVPETEAVEEYREPRAPQAPRPEPEQMFVMRNGQVTPIRKGTAMPGDTPYDPVAARTSAPVNQSEAIDTAREASRIAKALRDHKGFGGAFGVIDSMMPTLRQDTADAETLRDSLTSLLTLENMGKMKGVLSDSDMKVLKAASSTLSQRMGDRAAKAELDRIVKVMDRVGGPPTVDTPPPGGGASITDLVYDPATKTFKPKGGL